MKQSNPRKFKLGVIPVMAALLAGQAPQTKADQPDKTDQNLKKVHHIVVIYQENWSFDSLYGQFPGADGLQNGFDTLPQVDRFGAYTNLLYKTPVPLTGSPLAADPQFPNAGGSLAIWSNTNQPLPLMPYDFTRYVASNALTGDIVHRFYHEQLQIDNGALEPALGYMDKFVTWSDNPGLVLSYIDATDLPEGKLAQQYTLCDRFFHSAYGGSFLNHQWLVAAATPPWTAAVPSGFPSTWDAVTRTLGDNQLTIDGKFAVNTIQPLLAPFSPGTVPTKRLLINNTDPSQPGYMQNIGNRLDDASINWKWYSGGWNLALSNNVAANDALFQFHHQPFAYYTKYAPFADPSGTLNPATTGPGAHLQDEQVFFSDVAAGTLPPVSFIKPLGPNNEHPGYTDEVTGQKHVAELVGAIQNSAYEKDTVIVITYDENGGRWDHVPAPVRPDGWGVGTRVPGIVISPWSRGGIIDSHEYETVSILKLIERRFHLAPLAQRDANPAVSDLTTALGVGEGHSTSGNSGAGPVSLTSDAASN
jgi:phospholipase C